MRTFTVLAIDDSDDILALLKARLTPDAIKVVTATSGAKGLELAVSISPDLILLDVDLPVQSGLDILRLLKDDPRTQPIPVIFLTAETRTETKVHGFDLGAVDYVTKPFDHAELRARVRTALRLKHAHDMLSLKAHVDPLTGLGNRAAFDSQLAAEIATARRHGRPFSMVMVDLDHFKSINDTDGHPFGDLVLTRVGEVLSKSVRPSDTATRYGGEEFALLLPDADAAGAIAMAQRVRLQIRSLKLQSPKRPVQITASFGVADLEKNDTPALLLERADRALYVAKREGRDCVRAALPQEIVLKAS